MNICLFRAGPFTSVTEVVLGREGEKLADVLDDVISSTLAPALNT